LLDRLGKTLRIEDFIRLVISSETIFLSSEKNLLPTIQNVGDSFNHEVTHKDINSTEINWIKESKQPEQVIPQNLTASSVPTFPNVTPTYSQRSCPTLTPFIEKNQQIVGQDVVEKLIKKEVPGKDEVRVKPKEIPGILRCDTTTAGLHEIVPTNQRTILARIEDDKFRHAIALIQSGARTSTALTIFNQYNPKYQADPDKQLVAHSGLFYPASSHTKGQPHAHDQLRKPMEALADFSGDELLIYYGNQHLNISPHGKKIMEDPGITGEVSILRQIGGISKPLKQSGINFWYSKEPFSPKLLRVPDDFCLDEVQPLDPSYSELIKKLLVSIPRVEPVKTSRAKFAIKLHEPREKIKDRLRAVINSISPNPGARPNGRIRSPSPCRTPIIVDHEATYTGGDYQDGYERPLPDLPTFPTLADKAAWIMAPQRLGFKDT